MPATLSPPLTWGLEVRDLEIRRGRSSILTDFSWTHHPGEIAWIIGENGAGKSSLLRVLAGHERAAGGTVTRTAPPGTDPAVLYYHPAMALPDLATVGAWQTFVERITPPEDRYPLVPDLIPASALPEKRVERLSTGEAKRLALQALLRRTAPFLILDEPFEHLSPNAKMSLASYLSARALDTVIIVATNQEIPAESHGPILSYDGNRLNPIRLPGES